MKSNANPICPRCGYELAGTVATWRESCPLTGRCSECGFELDWTDVFIVNEHPWLFEYHWRRKPLRRMALTIFNALRPRRFWRSVKLTDPIHLKPAMIVAAACLVMGLIAAIASEVHGRHSMSQWWFGSTRNATPGDLQYWLELIGEVVLDLPRVLFDRVPGLYVVLFAMPLLFMLVPVTLKRAKVRRANVLRIWFYSLAWPACVGMTWLTAELTCEILNWSAAGRVLDPWEWIRFTWSSGADRTLWAAYLPGGAILTIACAWMGYWWWHACARYLRIPDSGRFVIVLMFLLWLLALTVEIYVQSIQAGLLPFAGAG